MGSSPLSRRPHPISLAPTSTNPQYTPASMIQAPSYPLIVNRARDDAYGRATHCYPADVNRGGYVNSSDHAAISGATAAIYESGYDPDYDLARNGAVGSGDVAACADRDDRVPACDGMNSDASAMTARSQALQTDEISYWTR